MGNGVNKQKDAVTTQKVVETRARPSAQQVETLKKARYSWETTFIEILCCSPDMPTEVVKLIFDLMRQKPLGRIVTDKEYSLETSFPYRPYRWGIEMTKNGNIAVMENNKVVVYDLHGEILSEIPLFQRYNQFLDFCDDGSMVCTGSYNVFKVNKDGKTQIFEEKIDPREIAVGPNRKIYVAGGHRNCIHIYDPDGTNLGVFALTFHTLYGIVVDWRTGNLITSDGSGIIILSEKGHWLKKILCVQPRGVTVDAAGLIGVSCRNAILVMDQQGNIKHKISMKGAPRGITVDGSGRIIVTLESGLVHIYAPK